MNALAPARARWSAIMARLLAASFAIITLAVALLTAPAHAQEFPALSGRVVDAANILSAETEAALTQKLAALETQSQRQLVVATVPDLGGNDVADYGYRLGRAWGIGDDERNDGVILLIAPNERRMHIAVGYGLEPVLTDAMSASIIRNTITPRFREQDFDGGITAGVDAIARQITLPAEEARAIAESAAREASEPEGHVSIGAVIFWLLIFFFVILPIIRALFGGGKKHRKRRGGIGPVIIWGGSGGGHSSWGSGGSSWGGGGFSGGGFSGGGGSFGGGGASGGW